MYRKLLPWYLDQKSITPVIKPVKIRHLPDTFTLLNWNVHKNNHHYKWLHDFRIILEHHTPALITFQEYRIRNERSILDKQREFGYSFYPNITLHQNHYGLLSAARAEIKECIPLLTTGNEPIIKTPKISVATRYELPDASSLEMINVHMINFVKKEHFISQLKQIATLCEQHTHLVLSGDFNTWNPSRMTLLMEFAQTFRLQRVPFPHTPGKNPLFRYPLDHIFYKGVKLTEYHLLEEIRSSDHKPYLATFCL